MAKQLRPIYGKVVAITGGARGIGKATAQALASEGARVAIGDLDLDTARRTAEELGERVSAHRLDVTERESFTGFLDEVESQVGPVDVLINNAGVMILGDFAEESDDAAAIQVSINLSAVILGTKLAIERMRPRGGGHIVNIASQAGKTGFPGGATYSATKFGVVGLCQAVRGELAGTGIHVTCVMPSLVDTELAAGTGKARGVDLLTPGDVADGIAEALRTGREDVWLPRMLRFVQPPLALLPPKAQRAAARLLNADSVLSGADHSARANYEDRASHSAES